MTAKLHVDIKGVHRPHVLVKHGKKVTLRLHKSEVLQAKAGVVYRIRAFPVIQGGWQYVPRRTGWHEVTVKEGGYKVFSVRYRPVPIPWDMPPAGEFTAMVGLVNDARRNAGMQTVGYNADLAQAAQGHAEDMATHGYFNHLSQDGRDFEARIKATAFRGDPAGENIASGFPDAQATFNGWMASDHHRTNILNSEFHLMGLGFQNQPIPGYILGVTYWVQDFGYDPGR